MATVLATIIVVAAKKLLKLDLQMEETIGVMTTVVIAGLSVIWGIAVEDSAAKGATRQVNAGAVIEAPKSPDPVP